MYTSRQRGFLVLVNELASFTSAYSEERQRRIRIMPTAKKIATVEKLTDKVARAKSLVFADYRGLKHKQLEELRKLLKKLEAEFVVAKNRLLLRALRQSSGQARSGKADQAKSHLADATATLFSYQDELAPLKELMKYFKAAGFGKAKGGFFGDTLMSEAEVTRLSQLPPRDMLLSQLVWQLKAPLTGLHYGLSWNLRKLVYALDAIQKAKNTTKN